MYTGLKFIALIPARGGSISIKDKNIQRINNVSLIEKSFRHAKKSKYIDECYISTNDDKVMLEAEACGISIIERPNEISGPLSKTEECMLHACDFLNLADNDYLVVLQPTSPFRSKGLIDRCITTVVNGGYDSCATAWRFHDFCFYRESDDSKEWLSTFDVLDRPMRQQLKCNQWKYFEAGNCYVTNVGLLRKTGCRLCGKMAVVEISHIESFQIDDPKDLETAKCMNHP